ncbi:GntR family transcriptional regulator [Patulibacter minatonensis]|uniref:GntR family transcriptional regulator n=1 Tax=Patulibacter minatonensis TaxID=298163 RepID=UPI00047CD331|nr:GntR family transcriptional regulator [Patulibacter minatonensis]
MVETTGITPSASRRVYEHVKRRLVDGSLEDGVLLSEGAVADEVGVSRTPVREAFLLLEGEGLLALYPKRGALVLPVGAREARDMYDARALVEGDAVRTVLARPRDAALLADLRGIVAEQRHLQASDDLVAAAEADRRLHRAWVAAAGNQVLLRFFDGLRDRQDRVTVATMRRGGGLPAELVDEHEAIVDAVDARDVDRAVALLAAHLDRARVAGEG